MLNLGNHQLQTIFVASLIVIIGVCEIGRLLGIRTTGRGGDDVTTLEGAALGLLALMIGFTFAMALARFDGRRDAVLDEANAISSTALLARMLPAPHKTEILKSLREYVQIRLDMAPLDASAAEQKAAIGHSNKIQETLWQNAMALAAKDTGLVPTGLFIQSLNQMIDSQEKRLVAVYSRLPNIVLVALYVVAIVAFFFVGYANGLQSRRVRLPVYVMCFLVCGVILLIQDLDRPTIGFITVSQQPMLDTAAAVNSYTD